MGDRAKSLAEVKVDNIHCSSLIYPAGYATTEGYQIGQAWMMNSTSYSSDDITTDMQIQSKTTV